MFVRYTLVHIKCDVCDSLTGGADSRCSSMVNVGASGSDVLAGSSFDACGGTSGGSQPDGSQVHKDMRSALDAQSEASGAVERLHDAECLWNGACNRSDCKSNRRRNMKNGQRKLGGVVPTADDDDSDELIVENENPAMEDENNGGSDDIADVDNETQGTSEEDVLYISDEEEEEEGVGVATEHGDQNVSSVPASSMKSSSVLSKSSATGTKPSGSPMATSFPLSSSSRQDSSPSPVSSGSRKDKSVNSQSSGHRSKNKPGSHLHPSAHDRRLLYSSSHTDSSDSSFDDTAFSGPSLSREAVSDSFFRIAKQSDIDMSSVASTSGAGAPSSLISQRSLEGYSTQGRKSCMEAERPGLFSENNGAFMFLEQDYGDTPTATTTRERHEEGSFSLASGSVAPSSPGKENFGSSNLKSGGLAAKGDYSKLKVAKDVGVPSAHAGGHAGSQARSHSRQARTLMEDVEARAVRKRSSEVSQPLEKIPSPNSRGKLSSLGFLLKGKSI